MSEFTHTHIPLLCTGVVLLVFGESKVRLHGSELLHEGLVWLDAVSGGLESLQCCIQWGPLAMHHIGQGHGGGTRTASIAVIIMT